MHSRSLGRHWRDESFHASRRRLGRVAIQFGFHALRRLRHGSADQRNDQARWPARALRSESVWRWRGAGGHDDDQYRRSQFGIRPSLPGAGKDSHCCRGLAGHVSAQGRVHAAHRPGDGQETHHDARPERGRTRAGTRAANTRGTQRTACKGACACRDVQPAQSYHTR
ncbi:Chemotaxis response regulator protein-glutamate methylesterase CheB [Caballeronia sordidicola]|uniref:Chemotaxis response regulator protein-glutamate methylesterase CheB n=1 Tax=Caballeronia sordidicola TaxID=196367 RepID=A0A226WRQ9_CABSO|nr:Chemotaxis response regulator protein-glutamate methylesterase CheB [Caballeronia sordidicola]